MDTSQIKKFAIAARKMLLQGVVNKISTLGFNPQGNVTLAQMPVLAHNDTNFNGRIIPGTSFFHQWNALNTAIKQKGVQAVYEEVAYTWFNRLVAIRILQNQDTQLIPNVLDFVDDSNTPAIVNDARHGILPGGMEPATVNELNRLLGDDTKTTEQFAILISAFCEATPILRKIFGRIDDYTELLLPSDILAKNGFVDMLNNTEYITAEDYKKTELIGWLYQFYISERKDEVFDLDEWSSEDIPAGTQIFTPNWIVKYMVENTLGRIYLDNNPYSTIGEGMKYLVEQSDGEHPVYQFENMEDLRCADFSCGSGHILGEFFDLLYRIYTEEKWYDSRAAIESILRNNIVGVDLDTRAMQLSTFTLLLKACQKDESFVNAEVMPRVLDMPSISFAESLPIVNRLFRSYSAKVQEEVRDAFELIQNANELGSIMKFKLSDASREAIAAVLNNYRDSGDANREFVKSLYLILMLSNKYSVICMNPPYMGKNHMDALLLDYSRNNYPRTANDLGAIFMDVAFDKLEDSGKFGMINQAAWFFKPTYKDYREYIIDKCDYHLDHALYLGPGTFPELSGEVVQSVAFTVSRCPKCDTVFYHLKNEKNSIVKRDLFISRQCRRYVSPLAEFKKFGGAQFGFWVNETTRDSFVNSPIRNFGDAKQGLKTGDNSRFIRFWFEPSSQKWQKKWFPVETGGNFRKWYGNGITVLNWENDGFEIKNFRTPDGRLRSRPQGLQFAFTNGLTWTTSASDKPSFRYSDDRFLFESSGSKFFLNSNSHLYPLFCAYFNSKVVKSFIDLFSPGLGISEGAIKSLPFINAQDIDIQLATDNIAISKRDWDAHETSWDFKENELISLYKKNEDSLEKTLDMFVQEWTDLFHRLHRNEESLNSRFIELYGLQDELVPDISLADITILQQKEIRIENEAIIWDRSILLKQLISYAMGCWMGRYRLDRPGIHIAHPNPTEEELASYEVNGKPFNIDEDGIIPLMDEDCPFPDNAARRMKDFIAQVFGKENLAANLNYLNATLGRNMTLEKFFKNEFWKDHVARYQKRPIYWLFQSSSRNPAFQVIVYMHRMDAYTCEKVRSYLLSYIDYLNTRISYLENQIATPAITRELTQKKEALKECYDYELRLHDVANQQISFDLDDGVKTNYAKFGDVLAAI